MTEDQELATVAQMAATLVATRAITAQSASVIATEAWTLFEAVKKAIPVPPARGGGGMSVHVKLR